MSDEESLTQRTLNAAQWHLATGIVNGSLKFMVGILLARLLLPEDFGLLALALLFVGFAALFSNIGIAPSVIQRSTLTDAHVRVAFTLSTLFGVAVASILLLCAPLATWVFQTPGLTPVIRALSLTFVFSGLGATAGALMRRALDFKTNFFVALTSNLVGYALVATTLALAGFGVWSLVWASLAKQLVESGVLLIVVRHSLRPLLRIREVRELTAFGIGFSLNAMMGYIARTGDNLIVGRWLGTQQLGFYTRGYGLIMLPNTYVGEAAKSVLFPALSSVQSDRARLRRAYYGAIQLATILSFPLLAGMAIAAPDMIIGLYGEKWSGAVVPLQLLTLVGALSLVNGMGVTVVNSVGRPYSVFIRTLVYAALVLGLGLMGTRWQVPGVAVGVGLASAYMYLAITRLALKATNGSVRGFAKAQVPAGVMALAVALVAAVVRWALVTAGAGHLVTFIALVPTCGITAALAFRLSPQSIKSEALRHVANSYRGRIPRRLASVIDWVLLGH